MSEKLENKINEDLISAPAFGKVEYFERIENPLHREFVDSQSNCVLCSTVLELKHQTTQEKIEIKEEAYCPQCEMRTRSKSYILQ